MRRRRRPEQLLHAAVIQHLKLRGAPNTFAYHPANGGARTAIEGAIFKSLGVVAGVPDIIVIRDGTTYALELKADGGKLSETQRSTIERMRAAGAVVGVAHGIDQALAWLEEHGLLQGSPCGTAPEAAARAPRAGAENERGTIQRVRP